jgi:hypothetical protein
VEHHWAQVLVLWREVSAQQQSEQELVLVARTSTRDIDVTDDTNNK